MKRARKGGNAERAAHRALIHAPLPVVAHNREGEILFANHVARHALLGRTNGDERNVEAARDDALQAINERLKPTLLRDVQRGVMGNGELRSFDIALEDAVGVGNVRSDFRVTVAPLLSNTDAVEGFICFFEQPSRHEDLPDGTRRDGLFTARVRSVLHDEARR